MTTQPAPQGEINLAERLIGANIELWAFVAGLILFSAGLSWAWLPLGPIGAGVVLMAVSILGPRGVE